MIDQQTPAPVPVPVRLWRFKAAPTDYWLRDGGWLKTQPDHGGIEGYWLPAPAFASLVALADKERASKDRAYEERNRLVAFLSTLYPSSLERHPVEDEAWENDWRWIVFVDLPTGQASWHIHDSHLPLFEHLPTLVGRKWDGHTTEEKYRRVAALRGLRGEAGGGNG